MNAADRLQPARRSDPPSRRARGGSAIRGACLLALAVLLGGCTPGPSPNYGEPSGAWFEADIVTGLGDVGQPRATVTVSIPFRRLVFFQQEDGYLARYRLRTVQRVGDDAVGLREWKGEVFVDDYDQTRQAKVVRRTVGLDLADPSADRPHSIDVEVVVEGSRRIGRNRVPVPTTRIESGGITLGAPALYQQRDRFGRPVEDIEVMGRAMPDPDAFEKHRRGPFDLSTGPPWLYLRVFDLRAAAADSVHRLMVRVIGDDGANPLWSDVVEAPRRGTETSVLMRVPPEALRFGRNTVRVSMAGSEAVEVALENRGLDLTDTRSWEANLELVEIIATGDEMMRLETALATEREARWAEFWQRRDPVPETEVNEALVTHDERVAHARLEYRDGFRDGALSDRGRIWVLHGPPSIIETSAPGFDSNERFEVWRYRDQGLVYYFRDQEGFGTYRLVWRERA